MNKLLFLPLCVLLSSCDFSDDLIVREGFYARGFEVNSFSPCQSEEQWWPTGSGDLSEMYHALGVNSYEEVFTVVAGHVSDRGTYGAFGIYEREFEVTHVIGMRLKQAGDCE